MIDLRDGKLTPISIDEIQEIVKGFWMKDGACSGANLEFFFPPENINGGANEFYAEGRKICRNCPVRDQCLRLSLLTGDRYGMWGGLSPRERERIDNLQRWAVCTSCDQGFYYTHTASRMYVCGHCQRNRGRTQESRHYV